MMLKAHFNPAGIPRKENSESVLVSLFTPKESTYSYDNFCWTQQAGQKLYDLCVGTRKYTRDGQEKTAFENIGAIIMGDKNPYIMLKAHFNPAAIQRKEGSESISISLFKPKEKNQPDSYSSGYGNPDDFAPIDYENDTGFNSPALNPNNIPF